MNHTMLWVARRLRRRIPALGAMTLAHVGQALLGVAFALGSRRVIDSAVGGDGAAFRDACLIQGGIILGLLLMQLLYRNLHEYLAAELDRDWKRQLLHRLLGSQLHRQEAEVAHL